MKNYNGKKFWLNTLQSWAEEYGAEETGKAFYKAINDMGYAGAGYKLQDGESLLTFTERFIRSEYKSENQLRQVHDSLEREYYRKSNLELDRIFIDEVQNALDGENE